MNDRVNSNDTQAELLLNDFMADWKPTHNLIGIVGAKHRGAPAKLLSFQKGDTAEVFIISVEKVV